MKELSTEELKSLQLDMLKQIDAVCIDNNIDYFITGGTLLGAVRHNGYIPWDDDIDIAMPRKDYDRFLTLFESYGFDKYGIVSIKSTKGYYLPYAKVIHKDTVLYESVSHGIPIGVFVDVFPLDAMPQNRTQALAFFNKISRYRRILTLKNLVWSRNRAIYKNLVIEIGHLLLFLYPRVFLLKQIDRLSRLYEADELSQYVCTVVSATYGYKEIIERNWFYPLTRHAFEHLTINIPFNYDALLTNLYGDYLCLPPIEKRVTHHSFVAYWK